MIDIEFKKFYNDIKDPNWPDITNYIDFVKLPKNIQNECKKIHNLDLRKNQIEDVNYWRNLTLTVYQYQNLVYVPVNKCAHTYYTQIFESLGWEKKNLVDINTNKIYMFGLTLHPFTRWSKGMTEWVCTEFDLYAKDGEFALTDRTKLHNEIDIDYSRIEQNDRLCQLIKTVVIADCHTEPYTSIFGDLLDQVNWIPLDYFSSDNEIKSSLMSFFNACGHDIKLPLDNVRAWNSSTNKIKLKNLIDELFLKNNNVSIYILYKLYANDLKFYHNLIDNFTPDWQHIQGKISKATKY